MLPTEDTHRDGTTGQTSEIAQGPANITPSFFLARDGIISWKSLGALFAAILVVGWIFIVVLLIQEEKWQLVLVSWLLLYAAAHFCYWYFRRHNLLPFSSQFCGRRRGRNTIVQPVEKSSDPPPSYEEVIKSEPPPPTYTSITIENIKNGDEHKKKFSIFSFESISSVLSRSAAFGYKSKSSRPTSADSAMSTEIGYIPEWSPPPFAVSQHQFSYMSQEDRCPVYSEVCKSHVSRQSSSRSTRSSLVRRESLSVNETINPILRPIFQNINSYQEESPGTISIPNVQEIREPVLQGASSSVSS